MAKSDFDKAESYQKKMGGTLHLAVEELATAIGVAAKGVDEHGRLTEEGAKNFAELLDTAGKEQLKAQQDIQKQTDKIQADLNKAFSGLAKRIPIIGKDLERGFEKMMKNMTMRMDQLLTKTWGRLGAGMKGAMKIGAGGIVAAGALVLKQFNEIEKSSVELSKQTGLTGKNLKALRSSMVDAQNSGYKFGISMKDSAEATAGMVKSLGNFRKVSSEMVKTASLLAKYAGVSATEGAEFTGLMIRGFGKTAKQVMNFGNVMKDFATRSGVNGRKVMADIMQNTSLTSIYMSKGVGYLKRAAVQAAKLNMSMQETASATEMFLDIDQSAEAVGKINQYMGSSLNSLELFNLAAAGDTEQVMKRLGQAFGTKRGIRFMEEMPGLANKFGKEMGFSLKQMRIMAGLEKEQVKTVSASAQEQETIAEAVQSQQTTLTKISNKLKSVVLPLVNDIAEPIVDLVAKFPKIGLTTAVVGGLGAGLTMLVTYLAASKLIPQAVRIVGGAGGAVGAAFSMGGGSPGGGKGPGRFARMKAGMKGGLGGVARAGMGLLGAGGAASGMMTAAKGAATKGLGAIVGKGAGRMLLKKIPLVGAAVGAYFAFQRIKKGDWLGGMMELGSGIASTFPGIGTGISVGLDAALMAKDMSGIGGSSRGVRAAAKGAVVNKPTLFMAGEEGLPEMIVPTGRIARNMPINKSVASGLGGMGVPGFAGGAVFGGSARVSGVTNQLKAQANQSVTMGSMADPQTQRVRAIQYEQESQKRKSEQRDSLAKIEEKSLAILEEERNIAMDVGGPIGNFASKLGLWEKAKEAAGKYAKKTASRFWENMKKNNNDVLGSLKDTWKQTVGDIKDLQARLFTKLGDFASKMVGRAQQWAEGKLRDVGKRVLNWGMDKLGIGNQANRDMFSSNLIGGGKALGSHLMKNSPMIQSIANSVTEKIASVKALRGKLPSGGAAIGGVQTAMAGAGQIAQGDYMGAGKAMLMQEGKKRLGGMAAGMASKGSKLGGGYGAAAAGAVEGIAHGDVKAAGKGALEGAVGYGLGLAATAALTPFLGPAAAYVGPMVGAVVAGPATKGIMAGAKQQAKGIGNMWQGVRSGSFKQFAKGSLQAITAPGKMFATAGKELGKMFGIGAGSAGWGPGEARAKSLSQMAQGLRGKKPLLTGGGTFTQKKWQEGMAAAVKLGAKGPDQNAMAIMMSDIVRTFNVTPDIAQGFIYAALGSNMDEVTKANIENEITKGWGRQVGKGGWQADYDSGKLKQGWKAFRARASGAGTDEASGQVGSFLAANRNSRVNQASAGGFTAGELRSNKLMNAYTGGNDSGIAKNGNVYLDGVLVGVVAGSAAAGAERDGLPTAVRRGLSDRSWSNGWMGSDPTAGMQAS